MKEKRLRMYLVFWFEDKAPEKFRNLPGFDSTVFNKDFLEIAFTEQIDKKYIDFDAVLKEFLVNCEKEKELIRELVNCYNGVFNIEIVPEVTKSSFPAITLTKELLNFINTLNGKFDFIDFDTYIL